TRSGSSFAVSYNGEDGTGRTLTIADEAVQYNASGDTYSFNSQGIEFSFTGAQAANWNDGESVTFDLEASGSAVKEYSTAAENFFTTALASTSRSEPILGCITITSGCALVGVDTLHVV